MNDEPLRITFVSGIRAEQLREELARCPYYRGVPLLPNTYDVQIIELTPQRIEPDIEDEP